MTGYEKETIINYNLDEADATVFTYHPALIRKLDRLCASCQGFYCKRRGENEGAEFAEYVLPKQYVSVRSPRTAKRQKLLPETAE